MMLGRLLGLSAILLQIIVFLQPLFPEKHSVFLVCKTVAVALDLEVTSRADQSNAHILAHVQDRHEHLKRTKPCGIQNSVLKSCLIKPSNFRGADH